MHAKNNVLLAFLGIAAILAAVMALPDTQAKPPPAKKTYVGSDACKTCHAKTYRRYSKTAHANYIHGVKKNDLMGMPVDGQIKTVGDPAEVKFKFARDGKKLMLTLYDLNDESNMATFEIWAGRAPCATISAMARALSPGCASTPRIASANKMVSNPRVRASTTVCLTQ